MMSRAIYRAKLQWKLEELSYMTCSSLGYSGPLVEELPDGEGAWIKCQDELEVLGILLDERGNTSTS
eukprot:6969727-Karenia_brevis.AAC.1